MGEERKWRIIFRQKLLKKHFFASKCRQFLATFAKHFVPQNGFNSSRSPQMKSMVEKPKWRERKWRIIFRRRESVAMVAKFLNDNKPKTSQKWIRTLSNFVDLIQFQFICSLILLGKFSEVESGRTVSKCRKRKREILGSWFHVVVVQRRLKNVQKAWCTCKVVVLLL